MKRRVQTPVNSDGRPYEEGDVAHCLLCGLTFPDRDDLGVPPCKLEPRMGAHLELRFSCREERPARR